MTRIGTWNLAGRWSEAHEQFLVGLDCDVLLLTEVRRDVQLPRYHRHLTGADMAKRRAWAGVYSRDPIEPAPDPHPATAHASTGGVAYASTILPWRGAWSEPPWGDGNHASKTRVAVSALRDHLTPRTVWGGDFNHALSGKEWAGSKRGRAYIADLIDHLGLQVPTAPLGHRIDGLLSIDHIAVPRDAEVGEACRHDAGKLSDHAAYVIRLCQADEQSSR